MTEPDDRPPTRHRSFAPVVDEGTRLLILGSLPGTASLAAGRYYAHPQNQFWRLVGHAVGSDLASLAYPDRIAALQRKGVGLWDMVAEATRAGSLDSAIRDIAINDLAGVIARLPRLRALAFNGKTAARLAQRHLPAGHGLALLPLPSSSAAYTLGFRQKSEAWAGIAAFL